MVSARLGGFNLLPFSSMGYALVELRPLSLALVDRVVDMRKDKDKDKAKAADGDGGGGGEADDDADVGRVARFLKAQLRRPEYLRMASNPRMLSLLIHVLAGGSKDAKAAPAESPTSPKDLSLIHI